MPDKIPELSRIEARQVVLQAQGLLSERPFGLGKAATLRAVEQLGYVQIDTISVVERAHHHVLWSRVPDYRPAFLHELQTADRKVFEYWSHAASYLPWRDYRYCLPRMDAYARGGRHWFERDRKTMKMVMDRIHAEGPLQARDFEAPEGMKSGPWFDWKPSKRALEQLFIEGKLMIRERRGFQKVYDLAERVIPEGLDTSMPTPREMASHLIRQAIRSHGIASGPEMRYLRKNFQKPILSALRDLEDAGEIFRVKVEGNGTEDKHAFYTSPGLLEIVAMKSPARVSILSPFDNLVIQRKRMQRLFEFDYQIECYVPAPKRKHGYFVLPILWGDRLVARIDAKADRAEKTLRVIKLVYEPGFRERGKLAGPMKEALAEFAELNGCERVRMNGPKTAIDQK